MSASRLEFCVPFIRGAYNFDLKSQRCCKGNERMAAWRASVRAGRCGTEAETAAVLVSAQRPFREQREQA